MAKLAWKFVDVSIKRILEAESPVSLAALLTDAASGYLPSYADIRIVEAPQGGAWALHNGLRIRSYQI